MPEMQHLLRDSHKLWSALSYDLLCQEILLLTWKSDFLFEKVRKKFLLKFSFNLAHLDKPQLPCQCPLFKSIELAPAAMGGGGDVFLNALNVEN